MGISQELEGLKKKIEELIDAGPSPEEEQRLRSELTRVLDVIDVNTDKNVGDRTAEYKAATDGIGAANKAIVAAKADLEKVAETISKIAKVVSVLEEIASKVT